MSKSNAFEGALLQHVFQNANITNVGDATGLRGSSAAGNLYLSLHTADPGEAGTQSTSEIAYTGYARVAVVRSGVGFTVTGNSVSPANNVDFPEMTGGTGGTATNFGVGTDVSGAGTLLYKGTITPTLAVATGVTPRYKPSSSITED